MSRSRREGVREVGRHVEVEEVRAGAGDHDRRGHHGRGRWEIATGVDLVKVAVAGPQPAGVSRRDLSDRVLTFAGNGAPLRSRRQTRRAPDRRRPARPKSAGSGPRQPCRPPRPGDWCAICGLRVSICCARPSHLLVHRVLVDRGRSEARAAEQRDGHNHRAGPPGISWSSNRWDAEAWSSILNPPRF